MANNRTPPDELSADSSKDVSRTAVLRDGAEPQRPLPLALASDRSPPPTRRSILGSLAALTAGGLAIGSVSGSERDPEEVPMPEVQGPIEGGARTGEPKESEPRDISEWGYVEEEYFLSGEAMALGPPGLQADTADEEGEVSEYTTRMIVWRPEDMTGSGGLQHEPGRGPPDDPGSNPPAGRDGFSGTVHINWPNQTLQEDNPVTIINALSYMAREGHVGILLSAQKQGVDGSPAGCKPWDPVRYGDIDHPGDTYSYDILSQCTRLLKEGPGTGSADPLAGHTAEVVYASGVSQSAGMLLNYINLVQEMHDVVDGFLPFNTSSTPSERGDVRDDLVPVLWLISEDETDEERREDAGLFKLWEVAGGSHVNYHTSYWAGLTRERDHGSAGGVGPEPAYDEREGGQYGELGSGYCTKDGNYMPYRYALRAGLDHLDQWTRYNQEPPTADRIEREDGRAAEDEYGNAIGGLRLPVIDVPVAEYQAHGCEEYESSFGQTLQFDSETLRELYPIHEDYLAELEAAVDRTVEEGFLLEADANDLLRRAERSEIPESSGL